MLRRALAVRWAAICCLLAAVAAPPTGVASAACPYVDGLLVDDLLVAYPHLPSHALGIGGVAAAVHGGAARLPGGSFAILRAALDAAAALCNGSVVLSAGQTFFAPTDAAWQELEGQLGRGLAEVLQTPQLLCSLLAYNTVAPCGASGAPAAEASCGALPSAALVDQQALSTTFADAGLLQADAASPLLYMNVQQAWAKRLLRVTGYLKRGAAIVVPDLLLCDGQLVVHATDRVLVPAAALYADLERRVRNLPELSITAEAYDRVRASRGVTAQAVVIAVGTNIAVEPLIPLPRLPAAGMCRSGVAIAEGAMRTLLAPTNAAWELFFRRFGLTKAAVFADVPFLITLLEYIELEVVGLDRPYSLDGTSGGSRFFAFDLFRGQILRTVVGAIYLPVGTPVNVFSMLVDVKPAPGTARLVSITGTPLLATEGDNSANILVPDLVSCNGLLHIVDAVLVPPTLTTLQQISFRPELSLFKRLILSPGLEAVRRSLNIEVIVVGGLFLRTASIAVWAPTDAALLTALAYLGMTPDDILVPLIDPLVALAVRTQLVVYHLTADGLQRGVGRALRTDVLRTPLLAQGDLLPSLLLSPILQKPCNVFLLTSASLALVVSLRGVATPGSCTVPPGYPAPKRDVIINGRLNSARVIVPDIVSANGVLQIVDAALLPPTKELGLTVMDRVERTPGLAVYEQVVVALGLQHELSGRCLAAGDVSVWAPVDAAWLAFFVRLGLDIETLLAGAALPLLYDVVVFGWITADAAPSPLEPQFIGTGESYATALQKAWQTPAVVTFVRNDTAPVPLGGGEVLTSLYISGGGGGEPVKLVPHDARGNTALLLPPELLKGQLAINGDLHVTDRVLVPGGGVDVPTCRIADFEFFGGRAFASGWPAGTPLTTPPTPRASVLPPCTSLPCSYRIPDLYLRGVRLSLEVTVKYHHLAAVCDPWCAPGAAWWCVPCTGAYGQTIAILGGCAPYQPYCGGALALWVTDAGELRWGALTYATTFGLASVELGGGLRIVDVAVPGRGFIAKHGKTFKVLVTFDNVCQCVKLYVNDKLHGIGDPAAFARFGWPRFANVTGNLHEDITLGAAWHGPYARNGASPGAAKGALLNALRSPFGGGLGGSASLSAVQTAAKWQDISIPSFGGYAMWPSDPLLDPNGSGLPTQLYLPWAGDIHSALLWLDNYNNRGGTIWPSACYYPPPPDADTAPSPPGARAASVATPPPPPQSPPPPKPPAPPPPKPATPSPPPPRSPSPAPRPPPAVTGSCEGICGLCTGCLDAGCSCCCDAACVDAGDCCSDRAALCEAHNATTTGVMSVDATMAGFYARAGVQSRPVRVGPRRPSATPLNE